jgi:hypothetical protein
MVNGMAAAKITITAPNAQLAEIQKAGCRSRSRQHFGIYSTCSAEIVGE